MEPKTIKTERFARAANIVSGEIDEDARTVNISFSSEEPVERWFGLEILDHKKSSVRMDRMNNQAAVLIDHYSDQVGVVESVQIKDKKGYATLRFSAVGRGAEVFQDIVDGIRKNVSFGYAIHEMDLMKDDDGLKTYRSKDWEPYEISIVSIPADISVGVGRSEEKTIETIVNEEVAETEETKELMVKCKKCEHAFDLLAKAEKGMGYTSCPECEEVVTQDDAVKEERKEEPSEEEKKEKIKISLEKRKKQLHLLKIKRR